MKFIFLFALVAFGSVAAKKREPVQLVNPNPPDEKKITFDCVEKGKGKPYCGRRMDDYQPFFQSALYAVSSDPLSNSLLSTPCHSLFN